MPLHTTGELLEDAVARGTGLGAFNVITLEYAEAVVAERRFPLAMAASTHAAQFAAIAYKGELERTVAELGTAWKARRSHRATTAAALSKAVGSAAQAR